MPREVSREIGSTVGCVAREKCVNKYTYLLPNRVSGYSALRTFAE